MTCPHCKYENNFNVDGEDGDFYTISNDIKMICEDTGEELYLYGCPKCKGVFMA